MHAAVAEDETRLITAARAGDRQAFGELVCRYRAGVINVVYRMCGDASLAEDAAQTAFIRAWQSLERFQPHTNFRNWLYRIAVNAAVDQIRREKPQVNLDELPLPAAEESMEARLEQRERARQVQKAVLALPEASRAVLILREYEGLSYQEIADSLEIPIGTVMSRLSYARKCLMEALKVLMEKQ